ncbi:MAG: hypothetical protein L0G81_09860 [Ewingella sp.]|nr:hypothetical protein [Ewingella sp.]
MASISTSSRPGTIDVSAVAFANEHDWPTSASIMLAAYALGSILSSLMFGGLNYAYCSDNRLEQAARRQPKSLYQLINLDGCKVSFPTYTSTLFLC